MQEGLLDELHIMDFCWTLSGLTGGFRLLLHPCKIWPGDIPEYPRWSSWEPAGNGVCWEVCAGEISGEPASIWSMKQLYCLGVVHVMVTICLVLSSSENVVFCFLSEKQKHSRSREMHTTPRKITTKRSTTTQKP